MKKNKTANIAIQKFWEVTSIQSQYLKKSTCTAYLTISDQGSPLIKNYTQRRKNNLMQRKQKLLPLHTINDK